MAVCARLDYRIWSRLSVPLVGLALILLVLVLVPGVGVLVDGSSRWVGTGSFRIQPSELMKLALVVFGADLLARRAGRTRQWARTVRPMTMVFFLAGLLVMLQPDMGTTLVLASIVFGLLFAAGTRVRTLAVLLTGSVGGAVLLGIAEPYRRARLLSFLDPWAHRSDQGYQVVQSLVGLGSGHLWGVGLGASRAKWGLLPNAHTDFIFAIIGEELALIGGVLVVACRCVRLRRGGRRRDSRARAARPGCRSSPGGTGTSRRSHPLRRLSARHRGSPRARGRVRADASARSRDRAPAQPGQPGSGSGARRGRPPF